MVSTPKLRAISKSEAIEQQAQSMPRRTQNCNGTPHPYTQFVKALEDCTDKKKTKAATPRARTGADNDDPPDDPPELPEGRPASTIWERSWVKFPDGQITGMIG